MSTTAVPATIINGFRWIGGYRISPSRPNTSGRFPCDKSWKTIRWTVTESCRRGYTGQNDMEDLEEIDPDALGI